MPSAKSIFFIAGRLKNVGLFEANLNQAKTDEDNLRCWVDELEKLKPVAGEEAELAARRTEMMMNAEKILENLNIAYAGALSGCRYPVGGTSRPGGDRTRQTVWWTAVYDAVAEATGTDSDQCRRKYSPD